MAFETRKPGGPKYVYLSRRDPQTGKVKKTYLGRGPQADAAAAELESRRQQRQAERDALKQTASKLQAVEEMMATLNSAITTLMEAELLALGFHRANYSRWRKRRYADAHGRQAKTAHGPGG